jgi:hypothetical protein
MSDPRFGMAKALAEAGPVELGGPADTLDLFGGDPAAGSPVDGYVGADGKTLATPGGRRGRGRPPGAKNLATEEILRFLGQRYRHPVLGLADIANTHPFELAKLFVPEGEKIDREALQAAWKMIVDCTKEYAEYVMPKQPRALVLQGDAIPTMHVHLGVHQTVGGGVQAGAQGVTLGFSESAMKSMMSHPMGEEVLDREVLQPGISAEKSNG